jgi:hypothetical protein
VKLAPLRRGFPLADARGRHDGIRQELAAGVKKAPDVPGLKGDQLSLAAARRPDTIPKHKSGKARIADPWSAPPVSQ